VSVSDEPSSGLYRAAPIFDVVPLGPEPGPKTVVVLPRITDALLGFLTAGWDSRKVWRHIRAKEENLPLDLTVGSAFALAAPALTLFEVVLSLVLMFLVRIKGAELVWASLGVLWLGGLVAEYAVGTRTRDRLFRRGDSLVWQRCRRWNVLREDSVELARVGAVHDEGDFIRVVFDDGGGWELGKDIHVPRAVSRWLARRLVRELSANEDRLLGDGSGDPR
jgi:hypothetical protein